MTRGWFKCAQCGIECDNSVKAPGDPNRAPEICTTCAASFCPVCDSLYPEPEPTRFGGYFAVCSECGNPAYFDKQTAQNIKELNHRMQKETHQ